MLVEETAVGSDAPLKKNLLDLSLIHPGQRRAASVVACKHVGSCIISIGALRSNRKFNPLFHDAVIVFARSSNGDLCTFFSGANAVSQSRARQRSQSDLNRPLLPFAQHKWRPSALRCLQFASTHVNARAEANVVVTPLYPH